MESLPQEKPGDERKDFQYNFKSIAIETFVSGNRAMGYKAFYGTRKAIAAIEFLADRRALFVLDVSPDGLYIFVVSDAHLDALREFVVSLSV